MYNSISNHALGQSRHNEIEAMVSSSWNTDSSSEAPADNKKPIAIFTTAGSALAALIFAVQFFFI